MNEVLEHLKDGIRRFHREVYPTQAQTYQRVMSEPQRPRALIVTCSDSRLHPETLTQSGAGEIFVSRNIGNIVPSYPNTVELPCIEGGVSAVVEFAICALRVPHIAICGHTDCGAMKALLDPASVESMPTVEAWLTNAQAALRSAHAISQETGDTDLLHLVTEQNVILQMRHLKTHPAVANAIARGELTLSGWLYDIARGEVRMTDNSEAPFEPVEP